MTKRNFGGILLALACLGLSACDDYGSPVGVVQTAYVKLSKGDEKGFEKALTNSAFQKYASPEGMRALSATLAGYQSARVVQVGTPVFTPVRIPGFQTGVETSTVEVLGKTRGHLSEARVLTATVYCDVYEVEENIAPSNPNSQDRRADLEPAQVSRYTECKIADIQF